jgi:hypothetical protein
VKVTIQLRCEGNLYGIVSDDHQTIEVRCKRRGCGHEANVIVLHTISLATGQVTDTKRFAEPRPRKE